MSDFDPYLKWLGIREKNFPINHYRLLGLELFENDPDVISMAADRQMAHIRTYQSGPNGDVSQQILNELAIARRCLLMQDKKVEYDARLRSKINRPVVATETPSLGGPAPPPLARAVDATVVARSPAPVVQPLVVHKSAESMGESTQPPDNSSAPTIGIRTDAHARSKSKRREKKQLLWSIVGWISGGLAAVGIAAALLGSGLIGNRPKEDPLPVVDAPQPKENDSASAVNENSLVKNEVRPNAKNRSNDPVKPFVEEIKPPGELFRPDPFESRFDLSNLATYPRADPRSFGVFGAVKVGLQDKKTIPFEPSAITRGELIRVTPDAGAIVIGMAFTVDKDNHIAIVRPIFHDGFRAFAGNEIGSPNRSQANRKATDPQIAIAKPGYAVGEIEVSAVKPVKCIRIRFMKIGEESLHASNVYVSKWYGRETGPQRTIRNRKGLPVVGVYASLARSGSLETLSLVGLDPDGEAEVVRVAGLPKTTLSGSLDSNENLDSNETDMADDGIDPFDGNAAKPAVKAPVPSARERTVAQKKLPRSVRVILDGVTSSRSRIRAAKRLIELAEEQEDLVMAYVVLKEAEEMGISAGDARNSVDAIREIDKRFEIDFWKDAQEAIEQTSRNVSSSTALDFKDTMDGLIEEAKEQVQFDAAGKLLSLAIRLSKRVQDVDSTNAYLQLEKEYKLIEELTKASVKALAVLAADSENAKANLDQGDFLFAVNDDLDRAFKHWRKSEDKDRIELVELATINDQPDGALLAEIGDAWWAIGKSNRTLTERKSLRQAYDHFRKAEFRLTGREQSEVEDKVEKLRKLIRD